MPRNHALADREDSSEFSGGHPHNYVIHTFSDFQAIRDGSGLRIGYEIFFRDPEGTTTASNRSFSATRAVLAGLSSPLTSGQPSESYLYFVDITREFLLDVTLLPDPSTVAVLEIQPDVQVDDAILLGVGKLRELGYGIALDRYVPGASNGHDRVVPMASHVKIDMSNDNLEDLKAVVEHVRTNSNALLIGCRIETPKMMDLARTLGCDLFQGLALDDVGQQTHATFAGTLHSYTTLLEILSRSADEVDTSAVAREIGKNPDLQLRILRICNSAQAGLGREVTSIQQAMTLIGMVQLRQQVQVGLLQDLTSVGEQHLMQMIEYSELTELVGQSIGLSPGLGFLAGLLTESASTLNQSIGLLVKDVGLGPVLADDIRYRRGTLGETLKIVDGYKIDVVMSNLLTLEQVAQMHGRAAVATKSLFDAQGPLDSDALIGLVPPMRINDSATTHVDPDQER
jgi:c-di-GMP-related signal transduction protein